MWLFAGLGNPGEEYAGHRHNIGFMAIDRMASDFGFLAFKAKFQGLISEGRIGGQKIILLKPQTFMNNSGRSVAAAANFYKIAPERIYVFHDELDLEPAKIRVKSGGGAGGHNGIRSVEECLGTADFNRVRMGIGHPGDKEKVHGYVLSNFAKAEQKGLEALLASVAKHAGLLLENESDFMSKIAIDVKE